MGYVYEFVIYTARMDGVPNTGEGSLHKTKIDWCDFTWNPVWGCRNNCPYCYARKIAERFKEGFEPHWKEKNFNRAMPKKPGRIFVNSMSDIAWWEEDWINKVLDRIIEYPDHVFMFLTKQPAVYLHYDFPDNCWLGATATTEKEVLDHQEHLSFLDHITFLSIEPILEQIPPWSINKDIINWLIIGAETGNRKGKVVPEEKWLLELVICSPVTVFMKESLRNLWEAPLIQEFPR